MADEADGIVEAGREAAADVIELIHRVFDEYGFIWDPEDEFWDLLGDEYPYTPPQGQLWVMRNEAGTVVGSIAVELLDDGAAELHRLYLDAELRGRGLGWALLRSGEQWAAQAGCERVVLWSDTRFADAHRLYERGGYERTGERSLTDVNATVEWRYERVLRRNG